MSHTAFRAAIAAIRKARSAGEEAEARELTQALAQRWPQHSATAVMQGQAALRAGDLAAARGAAELALQRAGKRPELTVPALRLAAEVARGAGDMDRLAGLTRRLRDEYDVAGQQVLQWGIEAHLALLDWDEVHKFTAALEAKAPGSKRALGAEYAELVDATGAAEIVDALERWVLGPEANPAKLSFLPQVVRYFPEQRAALLALAEQARARWPEAAETETMLARLGKQGIDIGPAPPATPAGADAPSIAGARAQLAAALAGFFAARPKVPGEAEQVMRAIESRVDLAALRRPLVADEIASDVLISAPGDAGVTALVFAGIGDVLSLPIEAIDAFFAARGVRTIFLRDRSRLLFLGGIESLGTDPDESVSALARLVGPQDRIVCLSNSAGAMGALQYATALSARQVLCFGPVTNVSKPFLNRIRDRRGRILVDRLYTAIPPKRLETRAVWQAETDPPAVDFVVCEYNRIDRLHAEDLAGFARVSLHTMTAEKAHYALRLSVLNGSFGDHIDSLLG